MSDLVQISQICYGKSPLSWPFSVTNLGNLDRIRHDQDLADGGFSVTNLGNMDMIRHDQGLADEWPPIGAEGSPAPAGRCHVTEGHPWGPKAPSSRSERARPAGA